jgi:hypothetical protein
MSFATDQKLTQRARQVIADGTAAALGGGLARAGVRFVLPN